MAKTGLGRGLSSLLGARPPADKQTKAGNSPAPSDTPNEVPIGEILPGAMQPRNGFDDASLNELAESIRENGIMQPLVVRPREGGYDLIAGERRWRASQMAGLANVPIVIRDVDDRTALELALVENLQRENLDPIEEAKGYAQLVDQFDLTQEEVAAKVGKNRATVANALRLIKLPPEVQTYMRDGLLSSGHAKVILGLKQAKDQIAAAKRVIKKELSVRLTEELLGELGQATPGKTKRGAIGKSAATDAYILSLEGKLRERLGTKVALRYRKGKGSVDIKFFNDEDLQRILETLSIKAD
ncbi:MAG: ParB/RepB/Spo0J family partition protein [Verrucomicrobia bacterium]|nr:ParB/RepB/Spo0J family partition protein [Verrucomicrobiota bacterium]MBT6790304.1 ParB/RepB/Spo0J family partition protein [Verrucomicrobiota bacterium]